MVMSIFSDFWEYLNEKFQGQVPNLIFFAIGLAIGILIFLICLLIIVLLSKPKKKIIEKLEHQEIVINPEYEGVIQANKDTFINIYKEAPLKEKIVGIGQIMMNLLEGISSLYNPDSKDPIFEVSIERLVEFISYAVARLNYIIDTLLEERFHIVDVLTNHSLKNKKLAFIFEMLDKNRQKKEQEPVKQTFFSKIKEKIFGAGKKVVSKISSNIINDKFEGIIDILGEDINKLYSGQELVFNDITKKELKLISKEQKKALKQIKGSKGEAHD